MHFQELHMFLTGNKLGTSKQRVAMLVKYSSIADLDIQLPEIKYNTNQTQLQLNVQQQQLDDHFTKNLALALRKLTFLKNLYLALHKNNIGDIGASYLALALTKLIKLNMLLHHNKISDIGAARLFFQKKNLVKLTTLTLEPSANKISGIGASRLL
jgi:hypothetical protein